MQPCILPQFLLKLEYQGQIHLLTYLPGTNWDDRYNHLIISCKQFFGEVVSPSVWFTYNPPYTVNTISSKSVQCTINSGQELAECFHTFQKSANPNDILSIHLFTVMLGCHGSFNTGHDFGFGCGLRDQNGYMQLEESEQNLDMKSIHGDEETIPLLLDVKLNECEDSIELPHLLQEAKFVPSALLKKSFSHESDNSMNSDLNESNEEINSQNESHFTDSRVNENDEFQVIESWSLSNHPTEDDEYVFL